MIALTAGAAEAMVSVGVNAATDVTGFGLGGHLMEMLTAAGLAAVLEAESLPVFEGVRELLDAGHFPGGSARNLASIDPHLRGDAGHDIGQVIADAQTSGGLLISVPEASLDDLVTAISAGGSTAWVIGKLTDVEPGTITLV
jgi:selenide,water dikinase